jgi:hypothetical protein
MAAKLSSVALVLLVEELATDVLVDEVELVASVVDVLLDPSVDALASIGGGGGGGPIGPASATSEDPSTLDMADENSLSLIDPSPSVSIAANSCDSASEPDVLLLALVLELSLVLEALALLRALSRSEMRVDNGSDVDVLLLELELELASALSRAESNDISVSDDRLDVLAEDELALWFAAENSASDKVPLPSVSNDVNKDSA